MNRAQTPHDYLIGVSLLLITLFGVFAFVPGMLQPFAQPTGADAGAAADRLGERLVTNHTYDGQANTIDGEALKQSLTDSSKFGDILDRSGVNRSIQFVNVTVIQPDQTRIDNNSRTTGPDSNWRQPPAESDYYVNTTTAATAIRIVDIENDQGYDEDCEPACRIVVRVW